MAYFFGTAGRLWWRANLLLMIPTIVMVLSTGDNDGAIVCAMVCVGGMILSLPVIVVLMMSGYFLDRFVTAPFAKIRWYRAVALLLGALACIPYTLVFMLLQSDNTWAVQVWAAPVLLMGSVAGALYQSRQEIDELFNTASYNNNHITMEKEQNTQESTPGSSGIFTKALITGGLILLMLIPTIFIINLVHERKDRQKQVTLEVSQKWAGPQTVTGPFLFVPYAYKTINDEKKEILVQSHFWILPEELKADGKLDHETRKRSIYNVLLYRAQIKASGNLRISLPKDIMPEYVKWDEVKLCVAVSDFKGIESRVVVKTGAQDIELSPGLPDNDLVEKGLSAPAGITAADLDKLVSFSTILQLRGSESLHFVPLGGNSSYALTSTWPAPSFDGNSLPSTRQVNDAGFRAQWQFNKANLPFGTQLRNAKLDISDLAFGVTMVQPADQYAKSERTVKYAILIIGLTFSLFFIVEIMQKKPVHPVQYILVGLALVIFYTLLLSMSEFIEFDYAYGVAAFATIALISFYVKWHFGLWRSVALFSLVLVLLYTFIFVLVRLEDTALLVGSIGLFLILAIAMYFSRKINWYGHREQTLLTT